MSERKGRVLKFETFEEVIAEAEKLSLEGYVSSGQWDLAQVCDHLAAWLTFPMDGFPRPPLLMRWLLWLLRLTVGRLELQRVLESGHLPQGGPTFRSTILPAGRSEVAAIKRLQRVMVRFERFTGPLHASLLYGQLTHAQWYRMHLIHCTHHLKKLVPNKVGPNKEG